MDLQNRAARREAAESAPTPVAREGARAPEVWGDREWETFERRTREIALGARSERAVWRALVRRARAVMRAYSTGFFIASRFLPEAKRDEVEAVYAAVRYPDEVVDTFPLDPAEKLSRLDAWGAAYDMALAAPTLRAALEAGVPGSLAGFARVVRERRIPPEHYRAFLDAMRRDVEPRPFETLEELIDGYVYGSAVVVGYFLTHVYGTEREEDLGRALESARLLGIALQLTNFLRDVAEDRQRARLYLPVAMLREEGGAGLDPDDARLHLALSRVRRRLAPVADAYYAAAERDLDAFSSDCRPAIRACAAVYRTLNERIAKSPEGSLLRVRLSAMEKFRLLPPSKYWRIPLAYLRAL